MKGQKLVFRNTGTAPKMNSRNFPHQARPFMTSAYKSDADDDDDDDDDDEKTQRRKLLNRIKTQTEEQMESRASAKDFNALKESLKGLSIDQLRTIADPDKGAMALIKSMGETVNDMVEQLKQRSPEDMSVRSQVAKWQEDNKEAIAKIKNGTTAELKPFTLDTRAAATMTVGNNLGGSAYLPKPEFQTGLVDLLRAVPTFWDYIKKGRTKSKAFVWVNKKSPDGAAAFIGEGVAKPPVDFELATEISNAKKIAVSLKASTEILDDVDGMTSYVLEEVKFALYDKLNTTLMTGTLSSTVPAGIQTISTQFTQTGLEVVNPNNYDVVRSGVAQLRAKKFKGVVTAFINSVDKANMDMAKAVSQGQYIMNATGAVIVEDDNVPVGYVQFAVLDYFKVLIYQDLTFNWGWENDDFTKNLVTVIAEMRIHSFYSENHAGAFIYDTFANIKTAIAAPAP